MNFCWSCDKAEQELRKHIALSIEKFIVKPIGVGPDSPTYDLYREGFNDGIKMAALRVREGQA